MDQLHIYDDIEKLLRDTFKPGKNYPYISDDEIYQNDQRVKKAIELVLVARENYKVLAERFPGKYLSPNRGVSIGKDYTSSENDSSEEDE